jgi:hypothetical protein
LEYQHKGLGEPEQVTAATTDYRSEMDTLAAFFEDRCVIHPRASVGATPLYNAYKEWAEQSGEKAEKQASFGRRLRERGFEREKVQTVTWHGIGLRHDDGNGDDPGGGEEPSETSSQVDGQSEASTSNPDQAADNAAKEGPNRLPVDSSAANRLNAETPIGKGNARDGVDGLDSCRPSSGINRPNPPREEINWEKSLQSSNRLKSEAATLQGAEEISAELGRSGSGPAKALAHYLAKPDATRLEYLARAVLVVREMDAAVAENDGYLRIVEGVASDPSSHPLDCECEGCL